MHDLLQIFVTTLHLVSVNLATAGPVLALWLYRRASRGQDEVADALGRRLLRASLHGLYTGIVLGIAAALLAWEAHPTAVARAVSALPKSRYYFGAAELAFSAACFELWLVLWRRRTRHSGWTWILGFLAMTNVVYHFPTLFSVLSVLSTRTLSESETVRFVAMLADGEVLGRVIHFLLASLALSGAVLYALATPRGTPPAGTADALRRYGSHGAALALVATLLQWPVGVSVLLLLPQTSREALLGENMAAAALFGLSLASVIGLMHQAATAAFSGPTVRQARGLLLWLGLTIGLMTAVRHFAREAVFPPSLAAAPVAAPSDLS